MTKTQIDRLGDRLRKGPVSEEDLRLLDQYRRSFADAYEVVVATVHAKLGKRPTGRPAKSTISIVDKLQRESVRLSQMQDIAGCRFIVSNVAEQQQAVANLSTSFARASIVDRREHPSHGYRAVHVVALIDTRPIEIQIRTTLQHLWAELSEKLADLIDPGIKYGSGDQQAVSSLADLSSTIAREEKLEIDVASAETALSNQLEQLAEARRRAQGTLSALSGDCPANRREATAGAG